jgi:hypothetical protein
MEHQGDSIDRPFAASLKATYRALLARGLEAGEAANLTAFLHGLPSAGFRWTLPEIEGILSRRLEHAAALRAASASSSPSATNRPGATVHDRRRSRSGTTHVIDPPKP